MILLLYLALVTLHLENCVYFWVSQYKKNVRVLESIQRRAAELVTGLEGMSYAVRLRTLRLPTLKQKMQSTKLTVLCNSIRRGSGEGGAEILFPGAWNRGRAQSCAEAHTALTFG